VRTRSLLPLLASLACATAQPRPDAAAPAPSQETAPVAHAPKLDGSRILVAPVADQVAACDAAIARARERLAALKQGGPGQPVLSALTAYDDALSLLADAGGAASIA
jgi:hypothetical protein